jgi:hypothetical protein
MDTIEELKKEIGEEAVVYKRQKLQVRLIEVQVDSRRYGEAVEQGNHLSL